MAELSLKQDRARLPLRFGSFYELYKKFLKEHGCKWHDVSKLLSVVAEILFDVDGACSRLAGKVSHINNGLTYLELLCVLLKYSYTVQI